MKKDARVSKCGKYRYLLTRTWDETLPVLIFMMLNPSTADALNDDPTIRRCIGFARDNGYGGIAVVNLYPLRTPSPKELFAGLADMENKACNENVKTIRDLLYSAVRSGGVKVVAAWGANGNGMFLHEAVIGRMVDLLIKSGAVLHCLGRDKHGNPRHPLYLKKDASLEPWP